MGVKVKEESIFPLLAEIDEFFKIEKLTEIEAVDLKRTIAWLVDKELTETNIQEVIDTLRGFKMDIDRAVIGTIIKKFRKVCAKCLDYQELKKLSKK